MTVTQDEKISKVILIVDDEEMLLNTWLRALQKEGHEVVCAQNGQQALQIAQSRSLAVIFSDMSMPGMKGNELLKRLREVGCDACVNIITGLAEISTAVASMRLGACDYIQKPCDLEELLALARRCSGHAAERLKKKALEAKLTTYEELDRLKSEFVSNVSHELRIPLFAMKGAFDLLRDNPAGAAERQGLLDVMGRNIDRLSQLIGNVLNYSRIERGALKTTFGRVNIAAIVQETVKSLAPLFGQKNIALPSTANLDHCVMIDADVGQLRQILTNLLSNAIKFTPPGGQIGVELIERGQDIQIVVWDSGTGIAPQHHKKIFERFYQVDGSITREAQGSGIGLAVVKSIVENHNGKIEVESEVGKGSKFQILLPKRQGW